MDNPTIRFLVVDDFATSRKIVIKNLAELGFLEIVEATNGEEAYQKLTEGIEGNATIGFIISDWNMPIMSGIDFLKKCRAELRFRDIPFILVTAEGDSTQIFDATCSGATDYLVKPFNSDSFKIKIKTYLRNVEKTISFSSLKVKKVVR